MTTRTLPGSRSISWHEANHAAALCVQSLVPKAVRTDLPTATTFGHVEIDWVNGVNRDRAMKVLIAVVIGGMTDGGEGWDDWPIEPNHVAASARGDAEHARTLAAYLALDRVDWAHVLWKAQRVTRRQDFRSLAVRIADELETREVLGAEDLRNLMEETQWNT
jgi:hypothetical protein